MDLWDKVYKLQRKRTRAYDEENDMNPDEIRAQIESFVNSAGYERLGSGDYRVVYGNGDTVVKVAWRTTGQKEMQSEYETWNEHKNTRVASITSDEMVSAERYLARVKKYDKTQSRWIMMEQVEVNPDNVTTDEADAVRDTLAEAGIHIDEIQAYNMGRGYRNGEKVPIVFDYGGT